MHVKKELVLKLILDNFKIPYDEVKDDNNAIVEIVPKQKGTLITWEGSGFEVVCK